MKKKTGGPFREGEDTLVSEEENYALRSLMWLLALGLAAIFVFSFQNYWSFRKQENTVSSIFSIAAILMLVAGAAFVIGCLMGFLFGIPRTLSGSSDQELKTGSRYSGNDNLLQVSDWLTKIIVGVGLTQMTRIPDAFERMGNYISSNGAVGSSVVCSSIVVYFGVCGLLISYLWTRLYFIKMIIDSDGDVQNDLGKMQKQMSLMKQYLAVGVQQEESPDHIKGQPDSDPQKGKWGGQAKANGRVITAKVQESMISKDYYNVELIVTADVGGKPLAGEVIFHLHPSFRNKEPSVIAADGVAKLNLLVWGAFTVGVEADNGETKLELDLAELPDAPLEFKNK